MAVVIRNTVQEIKLKLLQSIHAATRKGAAGGVILAPCAKMNPKQVEQAGDLLGNNEAALSFHCFYDTPNQMLCAVAEGGGLGSTHYASLALKDRLQQQQLLQGQLVVASFPESAQPTEAMVEAMLEQAFQSKGKEGDIRFFAPHQAACSVLLAEPDDIVRDFIKIRLELKGYLVHEARDGQEAYDAFLRHRPDLVVTELNLPILDGYQLIRSIQEQAQGSGQVIVLTDKLQEESRSRAYESGAADYVTKPLSFAELLWKMKRLTQTHENMRGVDGR